LAGIVLGCRGKLFDIFLEEVELLAKQQASSLLGDLTCLVAFIEGDFCPRQSCSDGAYLQSPLGRVR